MVLSKSVCAMMDYTAVFSFEEAQTVFFDPDARVISDPEHSESEERFIILGLSKKTQTAGDMPLLPGD